MKRQPARLLAIAAVFAALASGSASVIARAEVDRCHGTTYTLEGYNHKVEVLQLGGCTTQARQEFNDSLRLAADAYIARVDNTTSVHTGDNNFMYVGTHIVSAKLGVEIYKEGAAHPFDEFLTHNTNIDTGKAMVLADLFTDLQTGLNLLSEQSKVQLDKLPRATGYSKSAITPTAVNFQNWVATKEGMRIFFGEIASHAAGNIDITIPWNTMDKVLKPGMKTVLSTP